MSEPLKALGRDDLMTYKELWEAGLNGENGQGGSMRFAKRKQFGCDVKFATHLIRLLLECEDILTEGDIFLKRHAELLKDVRKGNWTQDQVRRWFSDKERQLDALYHTSQAVPYGPDEAAIKRLLLQCLEHHYGSLKDAVAVETDAEAAVREVVDALRRRRLV